MPGSAQNSSEFETIGFTTAKVEFHAEQELGCYTIKRDCNMGCQCEASLSKARRPSLEKAINDVLCYNGVQRQGVSGNGCTGRVIQEGPNVWVYEIDANVLAAKKDTDGDLCVSTPLLGGGADLTGRKVVVFGDTWTITGKNYLGDWEIERPSERPGYVTKSSISAEVLPEGHPHHAKLFTLNS